MARTNNPFAGTNQVYAGPYQGVGEGVGNLASLFMPDPNAGLRDAQREAAAWQARDRREGVIDTQGARSARGGLSDLFLNAGPGGPDRNQLYAYGVNAYQDDPSNVNALAQGAVANLGGSDSEVARALVGNGTTIGQEDAVSLGDRENVRGAIQSNTLQQDRQQQTADMNQAFGVADRQQAGAYDRALVPSNVEQGAVLSAMGFPSPNPEGAMSQEAALFHRFGNVDEAGVPVPSGSGGSGGGGGGFDSLDAKRRSDIESDADAAVNALAIDAGLTNSQGELMPNAIPPELRTRMLGDVMQMVTQEGVTPRAAAGQVWDRYVTGTETVDTKPWWPGGNEEQLQYTLPQQPQGGGQGRMPVVISDQDFDALPPGTRFQDENGKVFIKPNE